MLLRGVQTVSIHLPKHEDKIQGYINNQQQDWSFPLDGVSLTHLIMLTENVEIRMPGIFFFLKCTC